MTIANDITRIVDHYDYEVLNGDEYTENVQALIDDLRKCLCSHEHHQMTCDQCMKPEHDYCEGCGVRAPDLGLRRADEWPDIRTWVSK